MILVVQHQTADEGEGNVCCQNKCHHHSESNASQGSPGVNCMEEVNDTIEHGSKKPS